MLLSFLFVLFPSVANASEYDKTEYPLLTNIQTVYVETFDHVPITSKTEYLFCRFILVSDTGTVKMDSVQIRGRGNASWKFRKKPYRVKFPKRIRLLGDEHANAKSWVLLSNGGDKLLIRNALANYVSSLCNMPFTPATRFVDFYLNGDYLGNYQITDFVDIDRKRVDIENGGYLLEADGHTDAGKTYIKTPVFNNNIRIHRPGTEQITDSQKAYINEHIGKLEEAIIGRGVLQNYVDSASLMGWYLTNEICANCDIFYQIYFYKPKDDNRFYFSPVWDFDLGFNCDNRRGNGGDVSEYLMQDIEFERKYIRNWFDSLKTSKWWKQAQYEAYRKLYVDRNLDSLMYAYIDSVTSLIRPSVDKNYDKWNISECTHMEYKLGGSYDEYLRELYDFIKVHNAYLFDQFKKRYLDLDSVEGY